MLSSPDNAGPCLPRRAMSVPLMHEQTGSALVEFASSAILLFTLVFGILECSRAVYVYHFVASAAQEAARYAMVRGASWSSSCASYTSFNCTATTATVTSFVQAEAPAGVTKANLTVNTSWPGKDATGASCSSNTVGCLVLIKVTYPFSFASPLVSQTTLSLSSSAEVTIVQ
jgi:Flp pilus assembly protein TadG